MVKVFRKKIMRRFFIQGKTLFRHKFVRKLQKNFAFTPDSLLSMTVGVDNKNTSRRVLHLGQPGLGLQKEYFDNVRHCPQSPLFFGVTCF